MWHTYVVSASLNKYRHNCGEEAELNPLHSFTANSFLSGCPSSNTTDCLEPDTDCLHLSLPRGSFPHLKRVLWTNLYWSYVEFSTNFIGARYQYLTPVTTLQDMPLIKTGLSPHFVWSALVQFVSFNPQLVPRSKYTAVLSTALSRNVPRKNLPCSVCDKTKILYMKVCTWIKAITIFSVCTAVNKKPSAAVCAYVQAVLMQSVSKPHARLETLATSLLISPVTIRPKIK